MLTTIQQFSKPNPANCLILATALVDVSSSGGWWQSCLLEGLFTQSNATILHGIFWGGFFCIVAGSCSNGPKNPSFSGANLPTGTTGKVLNIRETT